MLTTKVALQEHCSPPVVLVGGIYDNEYLTEKNCDVILKSNVLVGRPINPPSPSPFVSL